MDFRKKHLHFFCRRGVGVSLHLGQMHRRPWGNLVDMTSDGSSGMNLDVVKFS